MTQVEIMSDHALACARRDLERSGEWFSRLREIIAEQVRRKSQAR